MSVHSVTHAGRQVVSAGESAARRTRHSRATDLTARLGFAARGVVYLLIGVLAIQIARGNPDEQANRQGALREIADKPFGTGLLVLIAVGFAGYALWRLLEGAVGHREEADTKKRAVKRAASVIRGAIYLVITGSTITFLASDGASSSSGEPAPYTARVMAHSGGRWLVGAIGLVVVGVGVGMLAKGVTTGFEEKLERARMRPALLRAARRIGQVGYLARGVVFGLAGVFVVKAAVDFDPDEAKGFDGTLRSIADQAYGQVLLACCAAGLALFGAYSFIEARYRRL
ncbi:protein of unknown function (DUF1206) [Parafrankia irregularis]|uniref:DUF1206 domain-containing protein n=2 Tax=Parafrankia TaxID=2994362 RepID=A0A0S4QFI1_9ACTN|nr:MULTISPECIES: DUF1206 domain-containing protein [Parafrankia]MBE3206566.1 DUF1206 domain-containing protein [Parafrankia sp. CH37]CUU53935.1 protein of unknown function (DUF1206) [Parafrankia irregularis]